MKTHLRSETMAFWNELIQSMITDESVADGGPVRTYRMEMWLFVGISITLLFLLILALVAILRGIKGNQNRMVLRNEKYNGAPVKV